MRRSFRNTSILLALYAVTSCVQSSATSIIPLSIEQLATHSTVIVHARAGHSRCAWDSAHKLIHTYTDFETIAAIQGSPAARFTVSQPGGSVDGLTLQVSGVRSWTAGEEGVLFLHPGASNDGSLVITGLVQGNFVVSRNAAGRRVVSNGTALRAEAEAALATNQTSSARTAHPEVSTISLDELRRRVARAQKQ